MKDQKTASMSCRVDIDLKEQFLELLESQDKSFSKWLRKKMKEELKKESE